MTNGDEDNLVNTLNEMLAVMASVPEGTNIYAVLASKVNTSDIVNNLTSSLTNAPLSAYQGSMLKGLIDGLQTAINNEAKSRADADNLKLDKPTTTITAPDSTYKWVSLLNDVGGTVKMLAGDLGKNIANSSLTSISGAGMTQGASYTWNAANYPFNITGLPDKSTDSTFNLMLTTNTAGQIAKSDGRQVLKGMPALLTDEEKTTWKTAMNGGWTTNTMSVGVISPPIINNNNNNNNTWFLLKGTNLNLNPSSFKVEIMNEAGMTVLATVPNSQVQLYQNGTDLIFYYNFSTLGLGKYKIRLWNGVAYYTTSLFVEVVNNVINFNLSNLEWQTKIYNDLVPKNISTSPNNVSMSSDLKNTDGSEFDEAQIPTGTVIGTIQSNAITDINGALITWADDFYINFDLNAVNSARGGAGITNNNAITLTPAVILGLWTNDGFTQLATTTAGNSSGRSGGTYGFTLTIIKRGSIATMLLQGQNSTTIGSVSAINTSENVYFKFFKYINRAPATGSGDTNGLMIKEAYKF